MPWPAVVFGWPFVVVSILVFFVLGVVRRQKALMWIGCAFAAPFCLYLGATPRFGVFALIALVSNAGAAWTLARGQRWLALVLLLPFVALAAIVARLVLAQ